MNALHPLWRRMAIVIVWDDFGGHYDHVTPSQYDVMGLGPRVPALILSPYRRKGDNPLGGAIDHRTYEFSSVLRFIEEIFDLGSLTHRDRKADPLSGSFDFSEPPDIHDCSGRSDRIARTERRLPSGTATHPRSDRDRTPCAR
jgi:phospholipase C